MSGHSAVFQKSMVDQNETLLQKPFPLFSEEVNAHLEQLNETVYYNDPVLVAFTLTTDPENAFAPLAFAANIALSAIAAAVK